MLGADVGIMARLTITKGAIEAEADVDGVFTWQSPATKLRCFALSARAWAVFIFLFQNTSH